MSDIEDWPARDNRTAEDNPDAFAASRWHGARADGASERRRTGCRRKPSIRSLIRGTTHPRRRLSRRADDHNALVLDWYPPNMLYLSLTIVLLSCTDALFTLNILARGGEEVNFFMRVLLDRSVDLFLWIKIALTSIAVVLLVALAHQRFMGWFRVVRVLQAACLGYAALIGYEVYLLYLISIS